MYDYRNFNLAQFPRAVQVAQAYQHYRIKKVTLTFKSAADTFDTTTNNKPFLYYLIDKAGAMPLTSSLQALKACGCKPRALDEKPLKVSWRPSVLEATQAGGSIVTNRYRISPWLSTNNLPTTNTWTPSQVSHQGILFIADAAVDTSTFEVDIEIQIQFKKPTWLTSPQSTTETMVIHATA